MSGTAHRGFVVTDETEGKDYYYDTFADAAKAFSRLRRWRLSEWDPVKGRNGVYNKTTREIRWLTYGVDPTPEGFVMRQPFGTYGLLPSAQPYVVM